jgi:hypothetical protein
MKRDVDGDGDDEYDAEASKIQAAAVMDSLFDFPSRPLHENLGRCEVLFKSQ